MIITSKDNEKVKYIRKLKENKYINKEKKFIVEGDHLVKEASLSKYLIETYSTYEDCNYGVNNTVISKEVMKTISNLPSLPSVIGICNLVNENELLGDKLIILDNVRDPGNLGTIIRSAKAFNISSVILSLNCASLYNEKVIRSTQGMLFKVNVVRKDLKDFIPLLLQDGYKVYATNVQDGINVCNVINNKKIAIIMGNEGSGISDEVKNLVKENVYISMDKDCESLNVAVAASIIMYELKKGE